MDSAAYGVAFEWSGQVFALRRPIYSGTLAGPPCKESTRVHELIEVFTHPNPFGLLIVALKTTLVYLFLVGGLRLFGKREVGQMNIYDLVLIIVLANAVQNAMVGNDTTLAGGLVAAITLLTMNRIMGFLLTRSRSLERFMTGEPTLILNDGKLMPDHMRREGITREEVMTALREHGLDQVDQVQMC